MVIAGKSLVTSTEILNINNGGKIEISKRVTKNKKTIYKLLITGPISIHTLNNTNIPLIKTGHHFKCTAHIYETLEFGRIVSVPSVLKTPKICTGSMHLALEHWGRTLQPNKLAVVIYDHVSSLVGNIRSYQLYKSRDIRFEIRRDREYRSSSAFLKDPVIYSLLFKYHNKIRRRQQKKNDTEEE